MIALEDEGPNTRENIVGLCRGCHRLWHGVGSGCLDAAWKPLGGWIIMDPFSQMLDDMLIEPLPDIENEEDRMSDDGCPNHRPRRQPEG
jgi:hypothetical protein